MVDTTNFNDQVGSTGRRQNMHVIERFQRVDANTILYRATIDDPTTLHQDRGPSSIRSVATTGPMYEYACHEGNYAMTDILGGAEKREEKAPKK